MSKQKQKPPVDIDFRLVPVPPNGSTMIRIANGVYKSQDLGPDKRQFFHLELMGNTWLLLDMVTGRRDPSSKRIVVEFQRSLDSAMPLSMKFDGREFEISRYTTVKLRDELFYHLDELPDGTWRLTHSEAFLNYLGEGLEHSSVHSFSVSSYRG